MGKKRYDSYSDMSHGSGDGAGPKMGTDTKKHAGGYYPGTSYGSNANVVGSRLNKGGDKAFMGGRRKPKKGY